VRPRRKMVLYSSDLRWSDTVRFVLETRLHVFVAETDDPAAVKALLDTGEYECALILGIGPGAEAVSRMINPEKLWWVTQRRSSVPARCGGRTMLWSTPEPMLAVMTQVRLMLARTRGPHRERVVAQ
jgi:hypothetical protein